MYADNEGNVDSIAINEGVYTTFVARSRDGGNYRETGTRIRIPTSEWRLLTDNDKKGWLQISTNGCRRILSLGSNNDEDTEQPSELLSARRGSSRQVTYADTQGSESNGRININTARVNDTIRVGTATLQDHTEDSNSNDTLLINTIVISNAMESAKKLRQFLHAPSNLKAFYYRCCFR